MPTLIIHRVDDAAIPVEAARYLAEHIPESQLVELPGADHYPFSGNSHDIIDEVEEFITGSRRSRELDRVLATVLFTDIVGSTERAAELGDARWRELLADHHRVVRTELDHARGKEVRLTGDGIFATFDGPARAVGCACAIRDAVRALGIEVAPACTPASSSWLTRARRGSPSTSARGSRHSPSRAKCSRRPPCATSSSGQASSSPIAARTSSRACPVSGTCRR